MLLAVCVLLHGGDSTTYSGRDHQLDVPIPRFEADVVIDGDLSDSVWARAARLTGFSQYSPNDDVPAADSTQVLVWYSATAIYFGIRAFEQHGRPTMTLANRDQIFGDDNVQILLGTFHDGKQALMFAVNPLGVQGDGTLIEGANVTASGFIGNAVVGREQPDLSPDFVYQSRGRVTDWGYEVEVRIPFKSIRYQPRQPQDWKLNIVREVQHSGLEDSWFPARRASATFVGQSGNLVGLSGMHRGLVMDLNPEATGKASDAPTPSGYQYDLGNPEVGGNIRWGVSDNLTLNGTIKPDFSQVESDAGQLTFDPRQAHACRGSDHDRAAVAEPVHGAASHLGSAQPVCRHRGPVSRCEWIHRPSGDRACVRRSELHDLWGPRGAAAAVHRRHRGGRHLAVSELHPRAPPAGQEAALQRQRGGARRVELRRRIFRGVVRLRFRPVRRLSSGSAARRWRGGPRHGGV